MKHEMLIASVVDELGLVKAKIGALKEREEALKADVIDQAAHGEQRSFAGDLFKATVSFTNRAVTDWKAVQGLLLAAGVKAEVLGKAIADATSIAEGLPVVRVSSL